MKIVIPGGTGQVGTLLTRAFRKRGDDVVVLSRSGRGDTVQWDGQNLDDWATELDGADVVINLAGRSVNCRYNKTNLQQMLDSRVDSTRAVGLAIEHATRPPRVWLQMSTATIYAHRFDGANDEKTGIIGGREPHIPRYWRFSVDIAQAWERTLNDANTFNTRRVAMRSAMVMSPDKGGVFAVLSRMTRLGLGGAVGGGEQFVSWIHGTDFVRAVEFLIDHDLEGPVNLAAPNPLPQREFMRDLRRSWGAHVGLPATRWMAEAGAVFMRTDTELLLKSRRVVPKRLLDAGFAFTFAQWPQAAQDLVERRKRRE